MLQPNESFVEFKPSEPALRTHICQLGNAVLYSNTVAAELGVCKIHCCFFLLNTQKIRQSQIVLHKVLFKCRGKLVNTIKRLNKTVGLKAKKGILGTVCLYTTVQKQLQYLISSLV